MPCRKRPSAHFWLSASSGEIPAQCNPQLLAQYLSCILQGMSISAREGATLEKLQHISETTLRLWPELLKI